MRSFRVLYCDRSNKKKKTHFDGFLEYKITQNTAFLKDENQTTVGRIVVSSPAIFSKIPSDPIVISGREVEILEELTDPSVIVEFNAISQPKTSPSVISNAKPVIRPMILPKPALINSTLVRKPFIAPKQLLTSKVPLEVPADNSASDEEQEDGASSKTVPFVPRVFIIPPPSMDTHLVSKLRPHQQAAVRFLLDTLESQPNGSGAILADEMGLGKTATTITVLWSYIKSRRCKAIIVTPSSLIKNWEREFSKWLGAANCSARTMIPGKYATQTANDFHLCDSAVFPILITSYESYRSHYETLHKAVGLHLLVCDEGHRLKAIGGSRTMDALSTCPAQRRILLSGTPIQNDLEEFYAMANFVSPDTLAPSISDFRKTFIRPIEVGFVANASQVSRSIASEKHHLLQTLCSTFMMRRSQEEVLKPILPKRSSLLLFCRPTTSQIHAINTIIQSVSRTKRKVSDDDDDRRVRPRLDEEALETVNNSTTGGSNVLAQVMKMRRICDDVSLSELGSACKVSLDDDGEEGEDGDDDDTVSVVNTTSSNFNSSESSKLTCLSTIINIIPANDKLVIVSNFTAFLSIIERHLLSSHRDISFIRLDGTIPVINRQCIVDAFNKGMVTGDVRGAPGVPSRVFLLSSKAGGMGLNITGANHIVLTEPDWNPATDEQAMSRVWREGQKKEVMIYRLIVTGSVEEVVLQRQLAKNHLEVAIYSNSKSKNGNAFTKEELKELFTLKRTTDSDTLDKMQRQGIWSRSCEVDGDILKELRAIESTPGGLISYVHVAK